MFVKYTYKLPSDEFYDWLVENRSGVEVLQEGDWVVFSVYEPIEGLEPLSVQEVKISPVEQAFEPMRVGRFLVCPPWIQPIIINPANAFGTGQHPTTQLCLKLIQDYYKEGWSAIDIGCGSGILSIALAKLGCKEPLAIDVDQNAVRACLENARLNGVSVRCIHAEPKDVEKSFDFLIANLEMDVFRSHMDHIKPLFRRLAIFSGIYRKKELQEFLNMLEDLRVVKVQRLKNWYAVVVER